MGKKRTIYAYCKICKKQISIKLSEDIAKDRDLYPFEYIYVHGTPEHALILFLDKQLALREAISNIDLTVVKKTANQFKNLIRTSEIDSIHSIYSDPLRLQLYMLLTQGPITEEDLIKKMEQDDGFDEEIFQMLILPLIRTGLVKTGWLQDTFEMAYFLIKDFLVIRTVNELTKNFFLKDSRFNPYKNIYLQRSNEILSEYKHKFISGGAPRLEETRLCLKIRSQSDYNFIYNSLWIGPQTLEDIQEEVNTNALEELIKNGFVIEIKTKTETYYALLTKIIIKKFTPQYLLDIIAQKLEGGTITKEMASLHLEYLYDADAK